MAVQKIAMKAKLKEALKPAMKAKDRVRLDTIRGILSEIQYEEMQRSVTDLTESDCTLILHRELKKRQESLQFAEQANREDSKTTLLLEISIIESFLPVQLDAQELERIILEVKSSTPDAALNTVMKHLKENYAGQYDGKSASEIAKMVLGGS